MMEESENRRERLKAMRIEAAREGQGGVSPDDQGISDRGFNFNPLVEPLVATSGLGEPNVMATRFDYYTNPMSAFSVNKGRSNVSHQISPDHFTPPGGPRNPDIPPRFYGSPMASPNTFGTPQHGNMNVSYGFPSNLPRGGNFPRPDFVQRGSPSSNYVGSSRGYGINNSIPQIGSSNWGRQFSHSGRGRSHWRGGNNSGPMQRGGRTGPRDNVSAELRPDMYYDKTMIEDPWKMLKPVISRRCGLTSLDTPDSSKSWFPKSINKKAKVSEEPVKYAAGKSLAEELAASFHAAASYEPQDNF